MKPKPSDSRLLNNNDIVKHKWVFDIKRNGIFRARLVACGYSQKPGIDFTDTYSPVVNDAVFRLLIVIQLLFQLVCMITDVETAFLNGDLPEEIYMDAPKGTLCRIMRCGYYSSRCMDWCKVHDNSFSSFVRYY